MTGYDDELLRQYEAVRRDGRANMITEIGRVQTIAFESEMYLLAIFIDEMDVEEYINMAEVAAEKYRGTEDDDLPDVPETITREVEI